MQIHIGGVRIEIREKRKHSIVTNKINEYPSHVESHPRTDGISLTCLTRTTNPMFARILTKIETILSFFIISNGRINV